MRSAADRLKPDADALARHPMRQRCLCHSARAEGNRRVTVRPAHWFWLRIREVGRSPRWARLPKIFPRSRATAP